VNKKEALVLFIVYDREILDRSDLQVPSPCIYESPEVVYSVHFNAHYVRRTLHASALET
jgi:hypothetical protein